MRKISAEAILCFIIIPYAAWATTAIYDGRTEMEKVKTSMSKISELGDKLDQTNGRIDRLMQVLINKRR